MLVMLFLTNFFSQQINLSWLVLNKLLASLLEVKLLVSNLLPRLLVSLLLLLEELRSLTDTGKYKVQYIQL